MTVDSTVLMGLLYLLRLTILLHTDHRNYCHNVQEQISQSPGIDFTTNRNNYRENMNSSEIERERERGEVVRPSRVLRFGEEYLGADAQEPYHGST